MIFQTRAPAGYVPQVALTFGARDDNAIDVSAANPLPIRAVPRAATAVPLAGTIDASGAVGPFTPEPGRPIWVTLSGSWAGTARLLRSIDGGETKLALTYPDGSSKGAWTANVNAAIGEESVAGASYFVEFTRSAGTLAYRVEQ